MNARTLAPPARAAAAATVIAEGDFLKFRDFFYRKTGIHFDDSKRYFVDKRLAERIAATGSPDFRSWFMGLRFEASGAELQALVNAMTVNETYFFREAFQFDCMVNDLLDELAERAAGRTLRIWSIPSSTGEEPYSIALYLLERWPGIDRHDVEILSSDIDTRVLDAAQRARYSARSVGGLPEALLRKYFEPQGGEWALARGVVDAVAFSHVNLADPAQTRRFRSIDLVFCRNLLIYFDDLSRRVAADAIYDALVPGGFVCLGHSESMSRISPLFRLRRFSDAMVYQKPLTGDAA